MSGKRRIACESLAGFQRLDRILYGGTAGRSLWGLSHPRYQLITPTIVLYEVYRKIKREWGEETALLCAGRLSATQVIQLTDSIAFLAADLSLRHGLAMADAIVHATARDQEAEVVRVMRI